jgi:hypothetical protein
MSEKSRARTATDLRGAFPRFAPASLACCPDGQLLRGLLARRSI